MRIQDMERKSGLDRATIRFYEKEGLLIPQRSENGYRSYSDDDLKLLMKIKLLRQLGVSLHSIQCLQQGREDFSRVLSEQIKELEQKIHDSTQAKLVCQQMQRAGAQYSTLDTEYYLNMLSKPAVQNKPVFVEPVEVAHHPIRRYAARTIDMDIVFLLIRLFFVCVIRVRPYEEVLDNVIQYGSYFLAVPLFAAVMLCVFGTTPGKWLMGIRLENANGGKLKFSEAFSREMRLILYGHGLFIPIISLWRLYASYKNDKEGKGNPWNQDTEIIYTNWTLLQKLLIPLTAAAFVGGVILSSTQSVFPRFRSDHISMEQFIENYKDCEEILDLSSGGYTLDENGQWISIANDYEIYINIHEDDDHVRPQFQYEIIDGAVVSVRYTDSWENADFHYALPTYCQAAIYTIIGSRPATSYQDYMSIGSKLEEEFYDKLAAASSQGRVSGSFTVSDVCVSWDATIKNCDAVQHNVLYSLDDDSIPYSLDLYIEII